MSQDDDGVGVPEYPLQPQFKFASAAIAGPWVDLARLTQRKTVSVVLDASYPDLDVVHTTPGWDAVYKDTGSTLSEQLGKRMYRALKAWLPERLQTIAERGTAHQPRPVRFCKMKRALAKGALLTGDLYVRVRRLPFDSEEDLGFIVVLSLQNFNIKQLGGMRNMPTESTILEPIAEEEQEEDYNDDHDSKMIDKADEPVLIIRPSARAMLLSSSPLVQGSVACGNRLKQSL